MSYRLVRRGGVGRGTAPVLDEHQRAVVDHQAGPLLVLAGPGTGKTTTLVESVVERIERRGVDPERLLVLTFSRKAAGELRERITGRLRRTTRTPLAVTFHSYAYALLRREAVLADQPAPRLLTGPEQLLEVRRLLHGELEDGAPHWPERLREGLKTRGFAEELRDFLSRAAERGLDGDDLVHLGRLNGRPDWEAAGRFFHRYEDRFDLDPVPSLDYAELIREAAGLLARGEVRDRERAAYDWVFVDEYQDTDPAQEALLRHLAGEGRNLVAVGDPDQSIYGFRGAEVQGILRFPERFRTLDGRDAPVIPLRVCRRSGEALLTASRRVAAKLGPARRSEHRDLTPADTAEPGTVRVILADSESQEAAVVADTLRRAHLLDGVPWSRMAVLVRSATRSVPTLRRALLTVGVPVVVAGDEVPLIQEPGVRPLVLLLRAAVRPDGLDVAAAEELLTGPIGGTDMVGVRRLRRGLRIAEREAMDAAQGELPLRSADEMMIAALLDDRELRLLEPHVAAPAERVARLIKVARQAASGDGTAEDALWEVWQASGLADRWTTTSLSGGPRGAQADRDLDGVVALFDYAAKFVDRLPKAGVAVFLDDLAGQEIPATTLAAHAPDGEAVRILTAHRAKGLEWDVVVVAGVQEGTWPDLRLRGSLLGIETLVEVSEGTALDGTDAVRAALGAKMLAEERRLFYVAATRARRRLVVTAVGGEDAEERPSRFLAELLPGELENATVDDRARWLSMPALVADLRATVCDRSRPEPLRRAAARHLARLAEAGVPGADPKTWYALTEISDDRPLAWPDDVVRISPSAVENFTKCSLRWMLETAVGAGGASVSQSLGTVIHAIAVLAAEEQPAETLGRRLDEMWDELDFGGLWFNRKQRQVAGQMVERFLRWNAENPRQLVAPEEAFTAVVSEGVVIKGRVDRVERDGDGRAVIIDIKTGSSKPRDEELDRHPQLGVYQLATLLGAFKRHGLVEPGGAALVQLGKAAGKDAKEQRQGALGDDPEPRWAEELVTTVAAGMSANLFVAKVNDGCRTCAAKLSCPVNDNGGQVC
ncbi:ATP-dependent helicase [Acrocarpospora catenulata]|uniref:ATP-dependent helicase n=1 Tax=Acrocarpospora catenulata TaxID=2836182 RepID=UPI001BDAE95E|nr:ATP-dependent DNA helicase [Acrocarpospora catenulata]